MNAVQQGIVTLIRSAITGKGYPLPADFRLEEAEELIIRHQIVGLSYEGALLCGLDNGSPAMRRLFQLYSQVVYRNNTQMAAVDKVMAAFEKENIDYLPVKGSVLKGLYPKPAMRVMTDADILIRLTQKDKITACMEALGYKEHMITDHEWTWDSRELCCELHTQLVPDFHVDYFHYTADGWQQSLQTGHCRYDLSPEEHYVFLFIHYAKHYRGRGIGLRQIVDLQVFHRAYPQLDMDYVAERIEQCRLTAFYQNTLRVLENWFAEGPEDEITEHITQYIFRSGSWGTREQYAIAEAAQYAIGNRSAGYSRSRVFWQKIFPPMWIMKNQFPVLRKAPWLLPVFWPIRWVTIVLFRRSKLRQFRHKRAFWSDEKITDYQRSLEYVGLR